FLQMGIEIVTNPSALARMLSAFCAEVHHLSRSIAATRRRILLRCLVVTLGIVDALVALLGDLQGLDPLFDKPSNQALVFVRSAFEDQAISLAVSLDDAGDQRIFRLGQVLRQLTS